MKKGLKGLFTASLAVVALGGLVACGGDEKPEASTTTPTVTETKKETLKDVKFTGMSAINTTQYNEDGTIKQVQETDRKGNPVFNEDGTPKMKNVMAIEMYDLELKGTGKDAKFTLTLQSKTSEASGKFTGTYEFFDGIGYTFKFRNETVRTKYDGVTKDHILYYNARLGEYGAGEVKLTCHDEAFQIDETMLFVTNANFGFALTTQFGAPGIATDHGPQNGIGFGLKLFADNKFEFTNNHVEALNENGSFTYDKTADKFTLHMKSGDVSSTVNKGIYTIPVKVTIAEVEYTINLTWNSNYYGGHGLSVTTYPMGAEFNTVLTLNNDGTCFLDGSAVNPLKSALGGMNLYTGFDRTGTWTYDDTTKQYTIVYQDKDMMGNPTTTYTYTSTYDEAKGQYKMKFKIGDAEGTLVGTDFGKDFTGGQAA